LILAPPGDNGADVLKLRVEASHEILRREIPGSSSGRTDFSSLGFLFSACGTWSDGPARAEKTV